jgi:3-deoxy-manno-octulosonate cytidylyltransferase (CMP-KDO synthetase)
MKIIGIIPARMGSSRFSGKPLEKIKGIPMVGHVFIRSKMSKTMEDVFVATPDKEIFDYIESINGTAIMTSDCHERCTDRVAEALTIIENKEGKKVDIVVNIQGDEPMIHPEMIDEAIKPLLDDDTIQCVNLMARIKTQKGHEDPNEVKVVVDKNNFAMYFSREPIPSRKKGATKIPMFKQVCVMPFRRDFLLTYTNLGPTPLEIVESVDMLRALEHEYKVKMVPTKYETCSVDTAEDLQNVERLMEEDKLLEMY